MVSFDPTCEETREDQRLYLDARLVEVTCQDCRARVRVKKNSEHHTSVQWDNDSLRSCAEFNMMNDAPGGRHVHAPCSRLRSSIEQAVAGGQIQIGAIDGY